MSGPIRRKLAPMVARLKRYINDAETDIPATDAMPTDEDAIIDLSRAMKEHMRKIGNCSHQVNEETNKWTTLISCLSSQERATEEAEWNKFDDNGKLSETIDKARETLENLQSLEIELRDTTSDLSDDEKPDDDIPGDKVDNGTKTDGTTAISTNKIRQDIIKLPNIDIKHYSGDPLEFAAFDEAFDAIIDSQPLAPIVKLNYLITYLDGSAKQAVDGYRIIGSNYPIIRAALAKRFGNVDTIKASLHAELDNLAPAIEGKVESLRNVIESINRIIRQMEAHGEVVDHPHIYTAIMKKVPKSVLKMLLQEKSRSTVWDFQKIEDELQRIVSLQEDVDRAYAESHPLHPTSNASNSLAPRATVMNVVRTPTTPCLLCNHFHWTQDCSTYTSGEARQQRIRELNACFKCLRTGHSSRQCNKKVVCHYCKHNHHTATCRLKSGGHQRNPRTKQYQHRDTHYPQHNRSNSWSGPAPQRSYERSSQPRPNQYVNRQHTQNRAPTPCNNRQTDQNRPSTTRQVNFAVPDHHVPATGANLTPLGPPRSEERAAFSVNTEKTQTTLLTLHIDSFNPEKPDNKIPLLALFDTGSDYSYISTNALRELQVDSSDAKTLSLFTFGHDTPSMVQTEKCTVGISSPIGNIELSLRTMPYLTHEVQTVEIQNQKPIFTRVKPQLLIGQDYFWEMVIGNPKQLDNGFFELETIFGPLLCGKREKTAAEQFESSVNTIQTSEIKEFDISQFWSLEGIGITEDVTSTDDQKAKEHFKKTVTRAEDGRYIVRFPVKDTLQDLHNNYHLSFKRLQQTFHRLKKIQDVTLLPKYNKIFLDQLEKMMIEEVSESTPTGPYVHYLPHHPVITPDKATTKLRIVYDGSAKTPNGKCLNDYLLRGPVLLPDLCGTLLRFRTPKIVITSDVEKAFLQMELHPDDRDLTRFLWVKDISKPLTADNVQTFRFTRVPFGIISSPSLLSQMIKHLLETYPEQSDLIYEILLNLYVDNSIFSAEDVTKAMEKFHQAKACFASAQMNLRDFMSNNYELNQFFEQNEQSTIPQTTKILGVKWELIADRLFISLPKPLPTKHSYTTKREVVQQIARVFDPLGLLAPAILPAKIFAQKLWKDGYEWDERLSKADETTWSNILTEWNSECSFSRRIPSICEGTYELHCFVDASGAAYAAVAYLVNQQHPTNPAAILFSKNRLCPIKAQTIPRLELMAILIGTKIITFIRQELKTYIQFASTHLWTDSKCALQWVITNNDKTVFVSNRIRQIQACQDVQYRYVNTKENPADLATRGATVSELKADTLWFEGPQFLKTPTLWPPGLQPIDILNLAPEIEATTFTCSKLLTPEPITTDSSTIDVRKFSKWNILIHSVILFLQFIAILSFKCKIKIKTTKDFTTSGSTSKRQKAIRLLIKEAQKRQPPPIQSQKKYRMFLDKEELWRCKHRVSNNAEFELHPYYLPPNDHLTTLIILYNHEKLHHSGIPATVAKLEQQFTIPKTRQTVKKVLKKHCMVCRRYQAKPYRQPDMPPLPTERVTQEKPFFRTGLDYFGHLWIKTTGEPQKVWVLLLTCFCTRAVHLEMVPDMTTLAFLRAFSRFTARKGQPHFLLSDNATQFHLASTLINGNVNSLQQKLTDKNITWTFIPALSPWQGGIYERMVGIVKTNLRKAIGRNMLTYDELNTVLCESENIVNSRPLTHVDSDGDNFTLKPCNFLFPLESYSTAETINTSDDDEWHPTKSTTTVLLQKWKLQQTILNKFWNQWTSEYLTLLKEKTQVIHKSPHLVNKNLPQLNEIVLIATEMKPRNTWPLGKIVELPNTSVIRTVKLKTASGNILTRPVNALYSLELGVCKAELTTPPPDREKPASPTTTSATSDSQQPISDGPAARTRSRLQKARTNLSLLTMICLLLCQISNVHGDVGRCKEINGKVLQIIPSCIEAGIRILQVTGDKKCWIPIVCRGGKNPKHPASCSSRCSCPSWATDCSFYNGTETAISKIDYPPLKEALKKHTFEICSTNRTDKCSSNQQKIVAHKIQLFDGNEVIVKTFHLTTADVSKEDKPKCIGQGTITGTSKYCALNQCAPSGTQFCYFDQSPITYLVLDKLHIPIKAWGHHEIIFYGPLNEAENSKISCSTCHAQCATGGLKITSPLPLSPVEICVQARCFQMLNAVSDELLLLPHSVQVFDHELHISAWFRGHRVLQQQLFCPAAPLCELITCILCIQRLRNLHCTPTTATVIMGIAIISLLIIVPTVITILCCIFKTTLKTKNVFHWAWKFGWSKTQDTGNRPSTTTNRKKRRLLKTATRIAIVTTLIHGVQSCVETTSFQAKSSNCLQNINGTLTCSLAETTILSLLPQGQKTCLLLHNDKDMPMGSLTLQMTALVAKCNRKTEFFTRDHKFQTASSKRCASKGACVGSKCEKVKTTDKCNEFSTEVNNAPGHLFCEASCGCWGCNCFICSSACLFYKVFAAPTSTNIYEVFSCPTYTTVVKFKATLTLGETIEQKDIELHDTSVEWNKIQFEIISKSIPPLPILANRFLQNLQDRTTRTIGSSSAGQPQPGTVGQLQCTSWAKAKSFDCFFPASICKCSNADTSTNCACPQMDNNQLIKSSNEKLPLMTGSVILQADEEKLIAKLSDKIQLQITAKNLSMSIKLADNKCNFTMDEIKGCFNCIPGARTNIKCFTNFGAAVAKIACETMTGENFYNGAINCNASEVISTISIHTYLKILNGYCNISCPSGGDSFAVKHTHLIAIETEDYIVNDTTTLNFNIDPQPDTPSIDTSFMQDMFHGITNAVSTIGSSLCIGLWSLPTSFKLVLLIIILVILFIVARGVCRPPISRIC